MQRADPGFVIENLLTFSISLPGVRYQAPYETAAFIDELARRLTSRGWARSAGATWPLPLEGQLWAGAYETTGTARGDPRPMADYRLASPALRETLGIELTAGRDLTDGDTLAVLVDAELARRNWPGRSPIGQWIRLEGGLPQMRVVGLVETVRHPHLRTYSEEAVYLPLRAASWSDWEVFIVVRTAGEPGRFVADAREVLHSLDPELPMGKVRSMESYLADRLAPNRFASLTTGLFALAALILAMVGLYGVLSYAVARRRYEIGVRMAVGATPIQILTLVIKRGLVLTTIGALLGVAGAVLAAGALSSLVYGIDPRDPASLAGVSLVTLLAGFAAAWFPALRAAGADVVELLREG
jgi:predicted permease